MDEARRLQANIKAQHKILLERDCIFAVEEFNAIMQRTGSGTARAQTIKSKKNNDASRSRRGSPKKTLQRSSTNSSTAAVIWIYKSDFKLWTVNSFKNENKLYSNDSLAPRATRRSGSWTSG